MILDGSRNSSTRVLSQYVYLFGVGFNVAYGLLKVNLPNTRQY